MKYLIILYIFLIPVAIVAQDDLEDLLNSETEEITDYTFATFKNTRVLNGHSIEGMKTNELEFRISHRFGTLNSGAYEFFGLDQAHIHLGLDYGLTKWLNIGIGRGTYQKTIDGYFKARLLKQSTGKINMPVSVSLLSTMAINSLREQELKDYFSNRLSYVTGILIARKFSNIFSLQLSPHYVHRNFVETTVDQNDLFACGIGGRLKINKRISINIEYFYIIDPPNHYPSVEYFNPLSIGVDIETGGHVFQLHITNSIAMIEKGFIGETYGNWLDGGIHFGFNISRVFSL